MKSRFNVANLYRAALKDRKTDKFFADLQEGIDEGHVTGGDFSVQELFEATVTDESGDPVGHRFVSNWRHNPDNRTSLLESGVMSTAFTNIMGQLLVNEVLQAADGPEFIGDQLCTTVTTRLPRGEKIPGMSQIGNEAEAIGEGKPYPLVGFGEDWIETPETIKRGMICPITREAVAQDLTGLILERARDVAKWIRYNKEIRILQTALGITSSYNRRGRGVVATYDDNTGNHDWDNLQASNTLVDWTDIENAELLFDAMVDPNTGTPIMVRPNTIVVPTALKNTAMRIINATEIRFNDAASNTTQTIAANPVAGAYKIVTSQLVKTVTSSPSTWFLGDFKGAFRYMEVSPITTAQAPVNSEMEFSNDIIARFKVSEWGVPAVFEPRKVVKNT